MLEEAVDYRFIADDGLASLDFAPVSFVAPCADVAGFAAVVGRLPTETGGLIIFNLRAIIHF